MNSEQDRTEKTSFAKLSQQAEQNEFLPRPCGSLPRLMSTHEFDAASRGWSTVTNFGRTLLQIYLSSPCPLEESSQQCFTSCMSNKMVESDTVAR